MRLSGTPRKQSALLLFLAVLGLFCPVDVRGATAQQLCEAFPCEATFEESCEEVIIEYDFHDGSCCMSFADAADGGGGCVLSVAGGTLDDGEEIGCNYESRTYPITAGEKVGELSAVGGLLFSFLLPGGDWANVTETCPESQYEFFRSSDSAVVDPLRLTLIGASSSWTDDDVAAWQEITEDQTASYYNENPALGFSDVITYIDVYSGETIVDTDADTVTLIYLQQLTWRSDQTNVSAPTLLANVFNTPEGKQSYLTALQASDSAALSAVTDISGLEVIEVVVQDPPQVVGGAGEPAGGAGGPASQTHETDTPPPTSSPQLVATDASVNVTVGEGEQIGTTEPAPTDPPSGGVSYYNHYNNHHYAGFGYVVMSSAMILVASWVFVL